MFENQKERYELNYREAERTYSNSTFASNIQHISAFNFSGNSLLQINLVHQKRPAEYHSNFFFFISIAPSGKNGKNKTYVVEQKITFKFEYPKLMELAYAIRAHAGGNGRHFGNHVFFADPSKATNVGENTEIRKGKRLSLTTSSNKKQNAGNSQYTGNDSLLNSIVINLTADSGTSNTGEKGKSISYTMNVYEAQTLADNLLFIAHKARDLHMTQMMKDNRDLYRARQQ